MKKNVRRWLALCLALVLMLSLAVVAAAATTASLSFTNITGAYTITMTKGTAVNKVKDVPNSPRYQHTYGTLTAIQAPAGLSVTHVVSLTSPYEAPLETLLDRVGLKKFHTESVKSGSTYYYIEPTDATGTYALKATFKCNNAPWTLVLDEPYSGMADPGRSETISSAPTDECYIELVKVS